jgi:hypothetical protein
MVPRLIDWLIIMLLLVLKLLVSSHPFKLQRCLCIYVLLFHEDKLNTTLLCLNYARNKLKLSMHYYPWSFVCVTFHVVAWLSSCIVKIMSTMSMFEVLWSQLTTLLPLWSKLCWQHVTSKIIFVITYLLEDEQELSLGMLIRCKRIYNFWCSMLIFYQ